MSHTQRERAKLITARTQTAITKAIGSIHAEDPEEALQELAYALRHLDQMESVTGTITPQLLFQE